MRIVLYLFQTARESFSKPSRPKVTSRRLLNDIVLAGETARRCVINRPVIFTSSFSTRSSANKRDLYSRMNISPKVTQLQIKEAYYKLSMKYHPDRNGGSEEAHNLFKEITEAYSVLGNNEMRRKYDRGLLREYPSPRPQSHTSNHQTSSKPMYDFDTFYQVHYGQALKREQMVRAKKRSQQKVKTLRDGHTRLLIIGVAISIVLLCGWHYGWRLYGKELKKQKTT